MGYQEHRCRTGKIGRNHDPSRTGICPWRTHGKGDRRMLESRERAENDAGIGGRGRDCAGVDASKVSRVADRRKEVEWGEEEGCGGADECDDRCGAGEGNCGGVEFGCMQKLVAVLIE